jgi:hypothetical protein
VLWFFSSFGFLLIWIWGLPLRFVSGEVFLRSSGSRLRLVIPALIFPFLSLVLWSDGRPGRAAPCLCDFGSLFSPVLPCSPPLQIPFTSRTPGPADRPSPCSLRIFLSQQISAPASFSPPRFGLYVPCPTGEASVCSWCSVPFPPQAQQFARFPTRRTSFAIRRAPPRPKLVPARVWSARVFFRAAEALLLFSPFVIFVRGAESPVSALASAIHFTVSAAVLGRAKVPVWAITTERFLHWFHFSCVSSASAIRPVFHASDHRFWVIRFGVDCCTVKSVLFLSHRIKRLKIS